MTNVRLALFLALRPLVRADRWALVLTVVIMLIVFVNLLFTDAVFAGIITAMNANRINYQYGEIIIEPKPDEKYVRERMRIEHFLSKDPRVRLVSDYLQSGALFINRKDGDGRDEARMQGMLWGIDPRRSPFSYRERVLEGRFLRPGDSDVVVLGKELAGGYGNSVFPQDLEHVTVGDEIDIRVGGETHTFTVVGILNTKNFDTDSFAFISHEQLRRILGVSTHEASAIIVRLFNPLDAPAVVRRLRDGGFGQYDIATWKEKLALGASISKSFEMIGSILRVIGALLAGLVVFIVIFVDIVNRRRQLGIFKAIGIPDYVIIGAYVVRGILYAVLGALFGFLLMRLIIVWFVFHPIPMPMADVVPLLKTKALLASVIFFLFAGLIGAFLPAFREIRKQVLQLLYH